MDIKTKFNIDDKVYFMKDNEPYADYIAYIKITVTEGKIYEEYGLRLTDYTIYKEKLYSNIEELKESLFKEVI